MAEVDNQPFPLLIRSSPISDYSLAQAEQIVNDIVVLKRTWPPYELPGPPTWDEDPYQNRSWRLYYHSLGTVSHLLDAYHQTGDLTFLVKARLVTESWLTAKGTPRPSRSDFVWNEHSVSSRTLVMIALFVHWQRSLLADERFSKRLVTAIHTHATWLADPEEYRQNNHGILQDRGLLSVAVLFPEFPESRKWLKLAKRRLLSRCRDDVSPSGVHLEHSPFYHLFFMRLYYTIREFLAAHGLESDEFDRLLVRMEHYLVHIVRNDKSMPLIGDTRHGNVRADLMSKVVGDELRYVLTDGAQGTAPTFNDIVFADAGRRGDARLMDDKGPDQSHLCLRISLNGPQTHR